MSLVWSISKHLALSQELLLTTLFQKDDIGRGSRACASPILWPELLTCRTQAWKLSQMKQKGRVLPNKQLLDIGALIRWSSGSHALYKAYFLLMISLTRSLWHPSNCGNHCSRGLRNKWAKAGCYWTSAFSTARPVVQSVENRSFKTL